VKQDSGLNKLCKIYEELDEGEKGKIIKLAEGLLYTQKTLSDEKGKDVSVEILKYAGEGFIDV